MANPDFCVIQSPEKGDIFFTVTESYNITRSASVTEYKVESGSTVADHHNADNIYFKFSGVVTLGSVLNDTYSIDPTPETVISNLNHLIDTGEVFTFLSDSELLGSASLTEDCILTNYDVSRDSSLGDGIEVTVDIQQIQFVETSLQSVERKQPDTEYKDREDGGSDLGSNPVKDEKSLEVRTEEANVIVSGIIGL